ncbi:hypothetical protein FACS1894166_09400 [Bacilli bacterium]|nr:hypothetical protein FACS1894166_09400 [Bacilli bacterium]
MEKQKLTATSVNKKKKIIIGCAVGGGIVGIGLAVGLGVGLTQHKEQGDQYKIDNVPTPLNLNVYADIKIFKNGDLYNGFDNDGCTLVPRSNTTNITFSKVVDNGAHQVMQYSSANGIEEQKTVIIDLIDHSGNALCTFTVVLNPAGADSYSINCYGKLLSKGEDTTLHIARNNYY